MKWRLLFPTWLIMLLLAPSILIHQIFVMGSGPQPLFIPFGVVHFGSDLLEQLARGDISDVVVIFLLLILPILIYTFVLSFVIYYIFRKT